MSHIFKKSSSNTQGFTLVEIMVTLSIMAGILTILLFNQRTYAEAISLNNLADNISITLAQAQAYGIAVREVAPGSEDFNAAYGLTFNGGQGFNNSFIFFVDRDSSGHYTGDWDCSTGPNSECLEKVIFSQGNYIHEICRVRINPNNPYQCNLGRVDISFVRPSPQAQLMFFNSQGNLMDYDPEFIGTRIGIRSPGGFTRSIVIYYTGQISVRE
jgi:prepilin-type N-terminal cleavage/methylation domain-containing protein